MPLLKRTRYGVAMLLFLSALQSTAQTTAAHPRTPMMGWSSWNNFHVAINEQLIREQADAMVTKGLKDAGYRFINVDDGCYNGRNNNTGELVVHPTRFPSGMKALAAYIHGKGLKAGLYSDAGINTCASMWDKDTIGVGTGLFGHDEQDLNLMLNTWGFDFIKVDWCGGEKLGLDEQQRYTQLYNRIKAINSRALFNICRWQFPGKWVTEVADSWRISGDIGNQFESILHIIDKNAALWKYSSPGHVNDMDMLQVGRGMSYEEDKSHFTMWCIMNSPLLLGNDLRTISKETLELVTNKEVIALNQDQLGYQARRLQKQQDLEIWGKPLISTMSGKIAVALLNRSSQAATISLNIDSLGIHAGQGYVIRDLWAHKTNPLATASTFSVEVPAHGVVALQVTGKAVPFNIFQSE